jgi:putative transposase
MSRGPRVTFCGAVYHITGRGTNKQTIFFDEEDMLLFLEAVDESVKRYNWLCHAYCLMPNHIHLLPETPEANIFLAMQYCLGRFAQAFNKKYSRVGHVFQGRYKSILVQKEEYLLQLSRYIALNPVRANLVSDPGDWQWSSYSAIMGRIEIPGFLQTQWILGQFGEDVRQAKIRYRNFVLSGIQKKSPWRNLRAGNILGDEKFAEAIARNFKGKQKISPIKKINRLLGRPPLEEIFDTSILDKPNRNEKILIACKGYGYRIREIAEFLGVHESTVSKVLLKVS